jgi:hypothetical protein
VRLLEDWVTQDNLFEFLNGGHAAWGPDEGCVLLCQFCEGFGNISKSSDKGALIAKDAKRAVDLFDCGKLFGPSGQTVMFHGVNADGTVTDNDAQVVDGGAFKFALGWL